MYAAAAVAGCAIHSSQTHLRRSAWPFYSSRWDFFVLIIIKQTWEEANKQNHASCFSIAFCRSIQSFHHYEWCHVISGSSNCKLANSRAPGYPGSCLDSSFVSQWLITMWQFMWFWLQVQGWSIDWHVSSKSTQPALLNLKLAAL